MLGNANGGKQPCRLSMGLRCPGRVCLDHGVHDREQFSHAGDDDDFGGLSGHFETLRKGLDCRIAAHYGHCGHVQDGSNIGAAAPDEALSSMRATVICQRSDAHQFGDFAPIELAQLRALGQQSHTGDCADSGNATQ
jgi:hypothetical protein